MGWDAKYFSPYVYMSTVSADLTKEAKDAFALFDKDSKGTIKTKDLGIVLRSIGFGLSAAQLKTMEQNADPGDLGVVKQQDFLRQLGTAVEYANESKNETRKALKEMATGLGRMFEGKKTADGTISIKEFRNALIHIGEKLSEEEFTEMCKNIKVDDSGRMKVDELADAILA